MANNLIKYTTRRTAIAATALALTIPESLAQAPPNNTTTSKPPVDIQNLIDTHINLDSPDEKAFGQLRAPISVV